jgi:hypothetical protein
MRVLFVGRRTWRDALAGLATMAATAFLPMTGSAEFRCSDLALVLAIDASGSIDSAEFALQQKGYAMAFRAPRVQSALAAAGTVDIAVVIWGDTEMLPQVLPFQRMFGTVDAVDLSRRIGSLPRRVQGNTGIGRGISTAIDLLEAPGVCAARRLVNVSGDGREILSPRSRRQIPLAAVRHRAGDMGITINALAIETDEADLAEWYRLRLITGPGAFVMRVGGFDTFAEAIVEKLAREIRPPSLAFARDLDRPHPARRE